ncbi:MAG: division/cell wall cluster transcriptional repressor MraZ [Candidatus Hydrogenedentes bacterium]|nr:division/cell wall cluster transcriptional repressor MraZ [Candidatus Hydrogenedentota bacterium]
MYFGESQISLDEKGRLSVPRQFRELMAADDRDSPWYMTRGFDGAIFVFPLEVWKKLKDLGSGHSLLEPRMLDFRRMFVGSATRVKLDRASRFGVPALLREYADLEKEGVLVGVDDHLELWSKEGWCTFQKQQMAQYKEMAAELFATARTDASTTEGAEKNVEN